MDIQAGNFILTNLDRHNIILGKNGCGKSHLLKQLTQTLRSRQDIGLVRYITPERAGCVQYQAHIEQNITSNANYLASDREKNQSENFKQQSATLFRRLEAAYMRTVDKDRSLPSFSVVIEKINSLLERIRIKSSELTFGIKVRDTNATTGAQDISSGEAELISLAIEILAFSMSRDAEKPAYFLMDEPDVHLHPDLQYRLNS